VNVAAPFFNTVAVPVGLALLFLMAVAPAPQLAEDQRADVCGNVWPFRCGPASLRWCSASRSACAASRHCSASAWGAFAGATAARSLVLSVRATRSRHVGWWRGLIGRTNGGMVVHLGVIVMAVGIIAATTYRHQTELPLAQGKVVVYNGHRFEFEGLRTVVIPSKTSDEALVKVDGGTFTPATTNFGGGAGYGRDSGHRFRRLR